jgi:O-antigen ligase
MLSGQSRFAKIEKRGVGIVPEPDVSQRSRKQIGRTSPSEPTAPVAVAGMASVKRMLHAWRARAEMLSPWLLSALAVLYWLFGWVTNIANILSRGGRDPIRFNAGEIIEHSVAAVLATRIIYLMIAVCLALSIWLDLGRRVERDWRTLLIALLPPFLLIAVSNPLNGVMPTEPQSLLFAATMIALWLHGPDRRSLITIGVLTAVTAITSLALGLTPLGTIGVGDGVVVEKALFGTTLLAGLYSYGNALGLTLVAGVPFLLLIRSRILAGGSLLAVVAALVWSASRTSWAVLGALAGAGIVLLLLRGYPKVQRWTGAAVLAVASATMIILPISERSDPLAFSERGLIWDTALDIWSRSPVFGTGLAGFDPNGELVQTVDHTIGQAHNFFVTTLFTMGIVGLVAVSVLVAGMAWGSVRVVNATPVPFLAVLATLAIGILETPSNALPFERPNTFSFVTWFIFAIVLWAGDLKSLSSAYALPQRAIAAGPARGDSLPRRL